MQEYGTGLRDGDGGHSVELDSFSAVNEAAIDPSKVYGLFNKY